MGFLDLFRSKPDPRIVEAAVQREVDELLLAAKSNLKRNGKNDPALIDEMFFTLFPTKFKAPGPDPMVLTDVRDSTEESEDEKL